MITYKDIYGIANAISIKVIILYSIDRMFQKMSTHNNNTTYMIGVAFLIIVGGGQYSYICVLNY